jgi:hypothetical protein
MMSNTEIDARKMRLCICRAPRIQSPQQLGQIETIILDGCKHFLFLNRDRDAGGLNPFFFMLHLYKIEYIVGEHMIKSMR